MPQTLLRTHSASDSVTAIYLQKREAVLKMDCVTDFKSIFQTNHKVIRITLLYYRQL